MRVSLLYFVKIYFDNMANTFLKNQKKLSLKQARWQEFLADFKFEWVHNLRRHNMVVDAISTKGQVGGQA